jgi:hypothetical protein
VPKPHFRHKILEAGAINRRSARQTLVAITDHDLIGRPTQSDGALTQGILTGGVLRVLEHLAE